MTLLLLMHVLENFYDGRYMHLANTFWCFYKILVFCGKNDNSNSVQNLKIIQISK